MKCNDSGHGIGEISKDLNGQGLAGIRGWWMIVVKKEAKEAWGFPAQAPE